MTGKLVVYRGKKKDNKLKQVARQEVKKALCSASNVEIKRHRSEVTGTFSTTATFVNMCTGMTQGLGDLNVRIGDRIRLTKMQIDGYFSLGDATNVVRMVVFFWFDDSFSNPPTAGTLFDDTTSAVSQIYGGINGDGLVPKNKKIQIIYDKRVTLSTNKVLQDFSITKNWKRGKTIGFTAGSANGLGVPHVCLISDSAAIAHPAVYLNCRLHYNDL